HRLYIKKTIVARAELEFPLDHLEHRPSEHRRQPLPAVRPMSTIQNEATRLLLSRYSPPGVLVDNDLKIVQFRGHTGLYLEPAPGEASHDLLKMAREGLMYGL